MCLQYILSQQEPILSTVFSTFDMDKLREKISRHHWKERLKISNIAKFESASAFPKKIIRFLLQEQQMK